MSDERHDGVDERHDDVPVKPARDATLLRRIEHLCAEFGVEPPLVVECAVDNAVSLLIFDLPVPKDAVAS